VQYCKGRHTKYHFVIVTVMTWEVNFILSHFLQICLSVRKEFHRTRQNDQS